MKTVLGLITATLLSLMPAGVVQALEQRDLTETDAKKIVSQLVLPSGHSVVVTFRNDEYIQSIWVDDPSLVAMSTDRPLCAGSARNCGFASSVRLMGLNGSLNLPGRSFTSGGGLTTLITINTTDQSGRNPNAYQFAAVTNSDQSGISMLSIVSDPAETGSSPNLSQIRARYRDRNKEPQVDTSQLDLSAIKVGRENALSSGRANERSSAWAALSAFMDMTEDGESIADAISQSGVSIRLLLELQRMAEAAII